MILMLDKIDIAAEEKLEKLSGQANFGFCFPASCKNLADWQRLLTKGNLMSNYRVIGIRSESQIDEESAKFLAEYGISLIVRFGSGVNNINHLACAQHGIVVENVAGQNANGVAELVFGMLFYLQRNLRQVVYQWPEMKKADQKFLHGQEISGKTMGIIGTGWIGSLVAQKAKAFGITVIATESDPQKMVPGVKYVSMPELCKKSDVISIHVPLVPENKSLIGAEEILLMGKKPIIINCAREGLVDLNAVDEGLATNKLGGFASDVDDENHPVFSRKETLLTPHIGAKTVQSEHRCALVGAEQAYHWLTQGWVINGINVADTSTKIKSGSRVVILNRDEPGAVAKITGYFAEKNFNIRYIENCGRAESKLAITLIELDAPVDKCLDGKIVDDLELQEQVIKVYIV